MLDQVDQKTSSDDIDPGRDRAGIRHHGLLFKFGDPHGIIHLDRSETAGVLTVLQLLADYGNVCLFCDMVFQYLIVIHLVHRIPRCKDHIRLVASS